MRIHQACWLDWEGAGRVKRQRAEEEAGMNSRGLQAPLLDGLAPSSALITLDSLCLSGCQTQPGSPPLGDSDSPCRGNVLAAIICDPQVYEKVECKHQDLNHLNCRREASCLVLTYGVMAKSRGALGTDHPPLNHSGPVTECACARAWACVCVCVGGVPICNLESTSPPL